MKGFVRSAYVHQILIANNLRFRKNFAKGYSDIQICVREATCNSSRSATTSQLEHIAQATNHSYMLADVIYILDKRLEDSAKNWRHVYKTLVVMEFCVCCGSESFVSYAQSRLHAIKTLREFVSISEFGMDNGSAVRDKSKSLYALLSDSERLAEARRTRSIPTDSSHRHFQLETSPPPFAPPPSSSSTAVATTTSNRRNSFDDLQNCSEEEAMARALAASQADVQKQQSEEISLLDTSVEVVETTTITTSQHHQRNSDSLMGSQLLDLDDDSFSRMLDSDILPNRRRESAAPVNIFHDSFSTTNQSSSGSNLLFDPFADGEEEEPAPVRDVHPIAFPGATVRTETVGAKPVLPGNFAPQFGNVTKMSGAAVAVKDEEEVATIKQPSRPSASGNNQPKDPFADLF